VSEMAPQDQQPFSRKAIVLLLVLGLFGTIGLAITSMFTDDGRYQNSPGSNSFSKSAVGHAALVELLSQNGKKILVSQYNTMAKLGRDSALFIIEPPARSASENRIEYLLDEAPILLVLPKRRAVSGGARPGWIGRNIILRPKTPTTVVQYVVADAEVVRPDHADHNWQHDFDLGADPEIDDLQLIKSPLVEPIISTQDGVLFGRLNNRFEGGQQVWILADPDLFATHGLARGWNSEFALAVADLVASGRSTLVVDEIVHGFTKEPSLAWAMFEKPFVYPTFAALLALLIFLLAMTRRFGAASRRQNKTQDSKAIFIENTARILHLAGKEQDALLRLMDDQALTIAEQLNAPRNLARKDLVGWLDEASRLRGIVPDFGTIRLRVDRIVDDPDSKTVRLMHQAVNFYQWKQEILDDTKRH